MRPLAGHRGLLDVQEAGELLARQVGGLGGVGQEVDPTEGVDHGRGPDTPVAAQQRRGPLAGQLRRQHHAQLRVRVVEVLPAEGVGDRRDVFERGFGRHWHPVVRTGDHRLPPCVDGPRALALTRTILPGTQSPRADDRGTGAARHGPLAALPHETWPHEATGLLDEVDLIGIRPLPWYVGYQDMADFADGITDERAGRRFAP